MIFWRTRMSRSHQVAVKRKSLRVWRRFFRKTSTLNTADFSPFDAQEAAERLASYYHRNARSEEGPPSSPDLRRSI